MSRSTTERTATHVETGPPTRRSLRGHQSVVVFLIAVATSVVLLLSGALDDHRPSVNIDPSAEAATTPPTAAPISPVMVDYLTSLRNFSDCASSAGVSTTSTSSCGAMPDQPDDPQLNAYLSAVLDWNKCAAPRLRRGGMKYAVEACGSAPVSPLGG